MRVDIFPTHDADGDALFEAVASTVRTSVPGCDIRRVDSDSPLAVLGSMMRSDVTVLDLTPADDGSHRYTAAPYPWRRAGVLAVSRSYLPVNVLPVRRGGAAVYPGSLTVDEIAEWVGEQLRDGRALRSRSPLKRLGALAGLAGDTSDDDDPWHDVDGFLSYRGTDVDAARALKRRLTDGELTDGRPQKVLMFEAGELAHPSAVLPPVLRWNVLSVISDIVRSCGRIWVVDSERYLESWWTQGELICRHYFGDDVALSVYSPETGRVVPPPERYQTVLSEAATRRMSQHFVNSHPDMMGPESVAILRDRDVLPPSHDHVFDDAFWTVPLLQCPRCSLRTGDVALDVERFLTNTWPRLYPVPERALETCERDAESLACPNGCGQLFSVERIPPAYLWFALPTGPSKSYLESWPMYSARPVGDA